MKMALTGLGLTSDPRRKRVAPPEHLYLIPKGRLSSDLMMWVSTSQSLSPGTSDTMSGQVWVCVMTFL